MRLVIHIKSFFYDVGRIKKSLKFNLRLAYRLCSNALNTKILGTIYSNNEIKEAKETKITVHAVTSISMGSVPIGARNDKLLGLLRISLTVLTNDGLKDRVASTAAEVKMPVCNCVSRGG